MAAFYEFLAYGCNLLLTMATYAGATVLLFVASKILWRRYILTTAEDRTSPLTKKLPIPPGDFGLPLIGETLSWAFQGSKFNSIRRKTHGKLFSTHFLGRAMVKVTGAENVRQILQGEHETVTTIWPTTIREVIGEHSIANTTGDKHKQMRRLALKGFTHTALNSYIPGARISIGRMIQKWKNATEPRKIYQDILQMTFEASAKAMVGITFKAPDEMSKIFKVFHTMISNLFSFPCDLPFSGFRKAIRSKEIIHSLLEPYLKKKLSRLHCNANENDGNFCEENDVMQHILEADLEDQRKQKSMESDSESDASQSGNPDVKELSRFSLEELKQKTVELMFGGYLTTGSSVSSLVIQLAKNPDVREKVELELEENGLLEDDAMETLDLIKIQKLRYLEQVIKELLRVMPPILGGYRKAIKTFQLGEHRIPKGWTIIYNIRDTHEYEFGEDFEFNPDRFSRQNCQDSREHRHRWVPFGGGPRVCVGKEFAKLELKLVAIEMVRAFKSWDFEGGKEPPMFAVPTLHPTNGLPVVFTPR